jgi:hypothetical protein
MLRAFASVEYVNLGVADEESERTNSRVPARWMWLRIKFILLTKAASETSLPSFRKDSKTFFLLPNPIYIETQ